MPPGRAWLSVYFSMGSLAKTPTIGTTVVDHGPTGVDQFGFAADETLGERWKLTGIAVRPHLALGWRPTVSAVLISHASAWPHRKPSIRIAQDPVIH